MAKYNSETYGRINRVKHPNWAGWLIIDRQKKKPSFPKNLKNEKEILDDLEYSYFNKK